MVSCDRVKKRLADYAVGGLGGRAAAQVERHLDSCPACRAELAALNRAAALVSQAGLESAPEGTWQAVRAQLTPRPAPRRRPVARRWVLVAAAAMFLLFGLLWLPTRRTTPARPQVVPMAQADDELRQSMQQHLAASESAPLADSAAIGLALGSWEDDS